MTFEDLGPFDSVLDVGGNIGEFAAGCRELWPGSRITSFEPVRELVKANRERARGRWWVEPFAISDRPGEVVLRYCVNQHSASTIMPPGGLRRRDFGIVDVFQERVVQAKPLDHYLELVQGRALLKVDVEGAEGLVLAGGERVLRNVTVAVVEVNQAPDIFVGAPSPDYIDAKLRAAGLSFTGVLVVQVTPAGELVQFDGVWTR